MNINCKHKFVVIRTIWPYEPGWGTYCKKCRMLVDNGIPTKEQAKILAKDLNKKIGKK